MMQRGRPRIDPHLRFADVIVLWAIAHDAAERGAQPGEVLASTSPPTENKAIGVMHRLNQARAALRTDDGHPYDRYVVRRNGRHISIEHRPGPNTLQIFDGEGNPISHEKIQAVLHQDPAMQRRMTEADVQRFIRPGAAGPEVEEEIRRMKEVSTYEKYLEEKKAAAEKPSADEHTRIGLHEIDPKKPLLDDITDE